MAQPTRDETTEALADIVRDSLERGSTVELPGIGTLTVEHEASRLERGPDGPAVMTPPHDVVRFSPAPEIE